MYEKVLGGGSDTGSTTTNNNNDRGGDDKAETTSLAEERVQLLCNDKVRTSRKADYQKPIYMMFYFCGDGLGGSCISVNVDSFTWDMHTYSGIIFIVIDKFQVICVCLCTLSILFYRFGIDIAVITVPKEVLTLTSHILPMLTPLGYRHCHHYLLLGPFPGADVRKEKKRIK